MAKKNREKYKNLKFENLKYKTAIALRCIDCQGYELRRNKNCDMQSCPLFPYQPKSGITKNKKFSALVSKLRNLDDNQVVVDEDYWANEFNKLEISFKKSPSKFN